MTQGGHGLSVVDLEVGYDHSILGPLTWDVAPGEILAVLGPSGCGKSTLLSTIVGAIEPRAGSVLLNNRNLAGVPIHERAIGLVFQEPLLFPHLSLIDNIAYGLRAHREPRDQARARAAELLDWVGLNAVKDQRPWEISGGQAGRIALARALAPGPQALLFDEPYSALDSPTRLRLAAQVKELIADQHIPAIHVTHDQSEAEFISTHILHLP